MDNTLTIGGTIESIPIDPSNNIPRYNSGRLGLLHGPYTDLDSTSSKGKSIPITTYTNDYECFIVGVDKHTGEPMNGFAIKGTKKCILTTMAIGGGGPINQGTSNEKLLVAGG